MSFKEIDAQYVAGTYGRFPVELVSGKGAEVFDVNGKRYIDMGSGIGVNAFGYSDDVWKAAVVAQLDKLQHASNLYYTEPCAQLAKMLCERTGMAKVFFGNSGAEANECAIKVARKWAAQNKGAEYSTIITLENSFHGRTLTTLAATGQEHYHELFQPLTPGFVHVPAGDVEALRACVAQNKVAGMLIECVQGEGGVVCIDPAYALAVEEIARENDFLLMIDEVQTGNGRSGQLYAYQVLGLHPDVVSTAKGLGGGLPLGACLMAERVQNVLGPGDHGSTFGGNPVACAGGLSVLSRLDEAFLAQVCEKGAYIRSRFEGVAGVESVSGMGMMIGLKTVKPVAQVVDACLNAGVLCLTAKDKLRFLPPLCITKEQLDEAIDIVLACL